MITARAKLVKDKAGVRLHFSTDLARLWNWFLLKETGMIFHIPLRSAKIGLYRSNSYHDNPPCENGLRKHIGKYFMINLDPTKIQYLYSKKGYWVCFLNVEDKTVEILLTDLKLCDNFSEWNRPHMSISNGKYFKNK